MPALRTLSIIEINGIGFSDGECEKLKMIMKEKLSSLEKECYHLAKRTFSLTSPDDVGRVLFIDLALPYNGNTEITRATRTKGKTKHFRTSKDVLEKLVKYHRLPKLILQWRRINNTLTKVVYPVQRKKTKVTEFSMSRIYCESQFHTCTGRVTFTEPNIQNVPKEFDVKISPGHGRNYTEGESPGVVQAVSMRSTFIPCEGSVLVSADYSQLELRIMAHLSSDKKLIELINTSKDVFKNIAAEINRLDPSEVNPAQRHQAKQVCYGILYGIGAKSLAEQLESSEEDAGMYMENFKKRFKGINLFIKNTVENCRANGYVKTISGRKRYLQTINAADSHAKAQAERQAVNTTVQGSAADLVKTAMERIHVKLNEKFQSTCLKKGREAACHQRGAYLILQIHDELLYEVNRKDFNSVVKIIREGMENAYQLSVKTPVKIHYGSSWGQLQDA